MHLRTRSKLFYCGLREQRKQGDISSLSVSHQGKTCLGKNSYQACASGVGHITTIPSQSLEQALLSHKGSKRTIKKPVLFLWKLRLDLCHCWLHRASRQHILISSHTSRCEVTTPPCSNTTHCSVVITTWISQEWFQFSGGCCFHLNTWH